MIRVMVPSEARIGETPIQATSAPFSAPIATATSRPANSASARNSGWSGWLTMIAAITSEQALAPAMIDRLMPPVSMVMPMPSASRPRIGSCEAIDWKLPRLKKRDPSSPAKSSATAMMIAPCRRMIRSLGINRVNCVMSDLLEQLAFSFQAVVLMLIKMIAPLNTWCQ